MAEDVLVVFEVVPADELDIAAYSIDLYAFHLSRLEVCTVVRAKTEITELRELNLTRV